MGKRAGGPLTEFRYFACIGLKGLAQSSGVSEGTLKKWNGGAPPAYELRKKVYEALVRLLRENAQAYKRWDPERLLAKVHNACEQVIERGAPPMDLPHAGGIGAVSEAHPGHEGARGREDSDANSEPTGSDSATDNLLAVIVSLLVDRGDGADQLRLTELALEIVKTGSDTLASTMSESAARALRGAAAEQAARDIAHALVATPLDRVIKLFAGIVGHELPHRKVDEDARRLAWHLLPISEQVKDAVAKVRAAGPNKPVELDLATRTFGEVAIAGAMPRSCDWSPHGVEPEGLRHVPLPASAHAAFFDADAKRVKEGVLANLVRRPPPGDAPVPGYHELWEVIAKENFDDEDRHDVAAAYIKAGGRYMLVIDRQLGKRSAEDITRAWSAITRTVGDALPGLRLVRLKGDRAARQKEYDVVPHVAAVRDGKRR